MTEPTTLPAAAPRPVPTAATVLTLADVTRTYGGRQVLGPVDFALDRGALAVVHGPNGAGKTTLLRVAAGLLPPTSGTRAGSGRAVYLRPGAGARHVLTVGQALTHTAALAGTPAAEMTADMEQVCRLAGLADLTGRRVEELSAGQHARLTVALAAVARPALACLDEPTAHLDPDGVGHVHAVVALLLRQGAGVLLASHTPDQFTDLRDATLALRHGLLREAGC